MAYPAVLRETRTKDDGSFRLEDLPGPTAAINLRRTDVAWPEEDKEIQVDREVELVFRGFGVIQGRVVEEPGVLWPRSASRSARLRAPGLHQAYIATSHRDAFLFMSARIGNAFL